MGNKEMKLKTYGLVGYKDQDGNVVIPCQWTSAFPFSEGLASVEDESGKWGFIDESGNVVIPCQWNDAHFFIRPKV